VLDNIFISQNVKMLRHRSVIHVEVTQRTKCNVDRGQLKTLVKNFVSTSSGIESLPVTLSGCDELKELHSYVERIQISTEGASMSSDSLLKVHIYKLNAEAPGFESTIELSEDNTNAAHCRSLPSKEFDALWDCLIYDNDLKEEIFRYMQTALIVSSCQVDASLIGLNRLILLSGPPGTGKTSLCKALAHKASIRMSDTFREFQLIEVNSHSLFSRWFSESGKLVQKMFDQLHELLEDPKLFLFVLIDEVESLTMSRKESKNEPSDGMRVVNALLTQIDQLKSYSNVLVLATSNLRNSIDDAFLDRADISFEVGLPSKAASYDILHSCITELKNKGLLHSDEPLFNFKFINQCQGKTEAIMKSSQSLLEIVSAMEPKSARFLRKIPFQALMKVAELPADLPDFLVALKECCSEK